MRPHRILLITCILLSACGTSQQQKPTASAPKFRPVEIPMMINSNDERLQYLASHYWDNFNFTDTNYLHAHDVVRQAVADYIQLLHRMPDSLANSSITTTLTKAGADSAMYHLFTSIFEKYLYDPNSPVRDETLYIPVLQSMVTSPHLDSLTRLRPEHQLVMAGKNRPGMKATDFKFKTSSGTLGTLYTLPQRKTLLFINNPGCHACKEYIEQIEQSLFVSALINKKELQVLALYPDEDIQKWIEYQSHIPSSWINAYDHTLAIRDQELYDLRAIPTLYLLDADRTVLLKDVPFCEIDRYLRQHSDIGQ